MSVRGLYRLRDGTFVRTQGEIPKGEPVNKIEVPVDSKGLCAYLNAILDEARDATPPPIETQPAADPVPAPEPPAAHPSDHAAMRRKLAQELRGMETEAIEERILSLKGNDFARVFCAGVERFGNLGKDAFQTVRGFLEMTPTMHPAYMDGLRMLAVMQIESLVEPKAQPKSYKELNG